jgi:hypothetical protein
VRTLAMLVSLLTVATIATCSSSSSPVAPAASPSAAAERVQALVRSEGEARALVELFGSRLQHVSLQSREVTRSLRIQYIGLVAPVLLRSWEADPSAAPGRYLSSPWPDHIEITALTFRGSKACSVSGQVVMMTSAEIAGGGAAALVPVHLELRRIAGPWLITGFASQGRLY